MPRFNFTFQIRTGKRTPIEVILEPTSVNTKTMMLPSGKEISDAHFAEWAQNLIQNTLLKLDSAESK